MIFTAILVLLSLGALLPAPTASQADDTALPLSLPPRVLTGTEQTCPPDALRQSSLAETAQDITTLIRDNVICPSARTQTTPAASCSAISASCPSGNYWIRSSNGNAVQMYCNMDRVCGCSGDSTGGWDVLHTSTQLTLPNSAQVHGGSSQHQGGRVDDRWMLLAATLQYFHLMESSTATSADEPLGIKTDHLMHLTPDTP